MDAEKHLGTVLIFRLMTNLDQHFSGIPSEQNIFLKISPGIIKKAFRVRYPKYPIHVSVSVFLNSASEVRKAYTQFDMISRPELTIETEIEIRTERHNSP